MIHVSNRFLWLVRYGDTTIPRVILAAIAVVWAAGLFLPGNTFDRPVYATMATIAKEEWWATAWAVYAVCLFWRTFSDLARRLWLVIIINGLGVVLYGVETACIVFSRVWPFPAAMAPDIVLTLVAMWVLMRSGLNTAPGWRDD